jgi:hypothetical protein
MVILPFRFQGFLNFIFGKDRDSVFKEQVRCDSVSGNADVGKRAVIDRTLSAGRASGL